MRYLDVLRERPESEHWRFPIAYAPAGSRVYTLREVVEGRPAIKAPQSLSGDEWRALVMACLRAHLVYQLVCPEGSVLTPREAVEAVEGGTAVGLRILAIERDYVTALLQDVYGEFG